MSTAEPRSPPSRDDDVTAEGRSDLGDGANAHPSPDELAQAVGSAHSGTIDATAPAIENGAISDARRRARRRRAGYALIAAASTLALVASAFAILGGRIGAPAGAPEVDEPVMSADSLNVAKPEVVGVWAEIHEGWIYVYDDGRVLSHPDSGPILERRLSPRGLDLVRRGTLAPQDLQLHLSMSTLPADVWSDPIPDAYRPDQYAVCKLNLDGTPEDGDVLGDVGSIWRRLPAHVQALFRVGRILSFTDDSLNRNGDFIGQDAHRIEPGPGVACFVLSPGQTGAVWAHTRAPEGSREESGELRMSDTTFGEPIGVADSDFLFLAVPMLPHGGWILWGG